MVNADTVMQCVYECVNRSIAFLEQELYVSIVHDFKSGFDRMTKFMEWTTLKVDRKSNVQYKWITSAYGFGLYLNLISLDRNWIELLVSVWFRPHLIVLPYFDLYITSTFSIRSFVAHGMKRSKLLFIIIFEIEFLKINLWCNRQHVCRNDGYYFYLFT